eukprot:34318-Chlamydomonas_euryale.AAC.1
MASGSWMAAGWWQNNFGATANKSGLARPVGNSGAGCLGTGAGHTGPHGGLSWRSDRAQAGCRASCEGSWTWQSGNRVWAWCLAVGGDVEACFAKLPGQTRTMRWIASQLSTAI